MDLKSRSNFILMRLGLVAQTSTNTKKDFSYFRFPAGGSYFFLFFL